jgi:hypothetical protein
VNAELLAKYCVTDKGLPSFLLMRFRVSCLEPVRRAFEFFAAPTNRMNQIISKDSQM